jgi:hypothetical protein
VNDLERRKKLLIAEAAVYRETLKLEGQNLRIYGIKATRKLKSFGGGNPLLAFGVPMLASLVARKRKARRWSALAFIGWQLYNRVTQSFVASRARRYQSDGDQTEAEEYLQQRM